MYEIIWILSQVEIIEIEVKNEKMYVNTQENTT